MKYQAVIFDLDGVIVSTDDCHYSAWKQMADEQGIYFDRVLNERLRGVGRMESLELILERADKSYSQEEKEELAGRKNNYYVELIQKLVPEDLLSGAMDFVMKLKEQGCKIAIGSSSKNAPIILDRVQLNTTFDEIVDGNDITQTKPNPEVFLKAAQRLSVPPEKCLVVEDADAGIEAALAAGMDVLGVGFACNNPKTTYSATGLDDIASLEALNV